MTMGDNYVLFEFSFISHPPNLVNVIQRMKEWGINPFWHIPKDIAYMDIEQLRTIRDWGCELQLNTISLTGYYGKDTSKMAESLVDNELVDFISSDMHHVKHAVAFRNALKLPYVARLLTDYPLKNIMLM